MKKSAFAIAPALLAWASSLATGCSGPSIPSYRKSLEEQVGMTPVLPAPCPPRDPDLEGLWLAQAILVGFDHGNAPERDRAAWLKGCLER